MAANLVPGSIFAYLTQIQATKSFFSKIWYFQSLDITDSYHHVHVQYQNKIMI